MTPDDQIFFQQFGDRLSALRNQHGLTQVDLAEKLGITQGYLVKLEKGQRRMPMSMLPILAELFDVSLDDLIGLREKKRKQRRGPVSRLDRQHLQLKKLPRPQQQLITDIIDAFLTARKAS